MGQGTDVHSNRSSTKGSQNSKKRFLLIRHLLGNVTRQFCVGVHLRISAISQLK